MKIKLNYLFIFCLLNINLGFTLDEPKSSKYDDRVKQTNYNRNDVVSLDGAVGVATHIELSNDEYYVAHAFGDADAWEFANINNHFFLKPIAELGDTNLTIVSNKRTYLFKLNFHENMNEKGVYSLAFNYPDEIRQQNLERQERNIIEKEFKNTQNKRLYSTDYTMAGNTEIAPVNIWDDGSFTYLKFKQNVDMPSVYFAEMKGAESIVNKNIDRKNANVVVIHKLLNPTDKFILRKDNKVMSIFKENEARNINNNDSGTISNTVHREVRK